MSSTGTAAPAQQLAVIGPDGRRQTLTGPAAMIAAWCAKHADELAPMDVGGLAFNWAPGALTVEAKRHWREKVPG